MKKIFKGLIASSALLLGSLVIVGCNTDDGKHHHNLEDKWTSDATKHWHKCSDCDEKVDKAAHTWGEWVIDVAATEDAKGSRHHICTVCEYRADEDIPMIEPEFGVTTEVTAVYAQVPADWTGDVNIYYWNDDTTAIAEGYTTGWPGEKMTLVNAENFLYGFKVPAGVANIIINGSGGQTVDLNYSTTRNLIVLDEKDAEGKYSAYYRSYTATSTDPELAEKTYVKIEYMQMYFKVLESWTTPAIHYWGGNAPGTAWPGTPLTAVDGQEHVFTTDKLPKDVSAIIITDGASENTKQTQNLLLYLDIEGFNAYEVTSTTDGEGHYEATPSNYNNGQFSAIELPQGPVEYYVMSSIKGWSANAQYKLAYDESSNSSSITVEFVADELFKVADSGYTHQFNASNIPAGNEDFVDSNDGGNIKVVNAGTYKITVNNVTGDTPATISFEKQVSPAA